MEENLDLVIYNFIVICFLIFVIKVFKSDIIIIKINKFYDVYGLINE